MEGQDYCTGKCQLALLQNELKLEKLQRELLLLQNLVNQGNVHKEIEANKILLIKPQPFNQPTVHRSTKHFLAEYKRYACALTNDESKIFDGLHNFLIGSALKTYKTFRFTNPDASSFEAISQELLKEYGQLSEKEWYKTFSHRQQGEDEHVIQYARDLKLLMAIEEVPELLQIRMFVRNLNSRLRPALSSMDPKSLDEAIRKANEHEVLIKMFTNVSTVMIASVKVRRKQLKRRKGRKHSSGSKLREDKRTNNKSLSTMSTDSDSDSDGLHGRHEQHPGHSDNGKHMVGKRPRMGSLCEVKQGNRPKSECFLQPTHIRNSNDNDLNEIGRKRNRERLDEGRQGNKPPRIYLPDFGQPDHPRELYDL